MGFFPSDDTYLDDYCKLFADACTECDVLAPMYTRGDSYIIKYFMKKNVKLIDLSYLDQINWI